MKLQHSLTPYTKINSKWIKDLNVRPDTVKLLEENIARTFFDINCSDNFLDMSPNTKKKRAKINKWDLHNLKAFAKQRKQSTKQKYSLLNGRKYLQMMQLKRG